MKKIMLASMLVLLVATFCFSQSPRNPDDLNAGINSFKSTDGREPGNPRVEGFASANTTTFANIAVTGNSVTGNPSYLSLTSVDNVTYYIWVDETGDLLMASHEAIRFQSTFPEGSWKTIRENVTGVAKVGGQS